MDRGAGLALVARVGLLGQGREAPAVGVPADLVEAVGVVMAAGVLVAQLPLSH